VILEGEDDMGSWTISTTTAEDDAIGAAYQRSQRTPPGPGPPAETIEAYFQRMTTHSTVTPMVMQHQQEQNAELLSTFATIPEANRAAAKADVEAVVIEHGGTVTLKTATYLWSTSTAPPPRAQSVELNVTQANIATVTLLYFDYLDANNADQMNALMALAVSTFVRIEDAATATNFLEVITTAAPIQRQGADGHVEIAVQYRQHGGTLGDTLPMTCTFD
jgi:hypothetical protein